MSEWTLSDLMGEAGLAAVGPVGTTVGVPVAFLTADSREVKPGACFVAVSGTTGDGHDFVRDAVRAGASSVVVERDVSVPPHVTCIRVADTRAAVARLAAAFHRIGRVCDGRRLRLIGITGTNGKSTTAHLLRSILEADGHRTALLGTIRYDLIDTIVTASLTTPPPIELCSYLARAASAGASYAVMEVSSHALAQRRCDGLTFDAGVFTNLSGDHLDYHQTVPEYLSAKKRLFDGLDEDALALVNADDPAADDIVAGCRAHVTRYAIDGHAADVRGKVRTSDRRGSTFDVVIGSATMTNISTALIGRHNVMNAIAAAGTAAGLGITGDAIRRGIEAVRTVDGRLQPVSPADCPFTVIVDYAHTDHALDNALRALKPLTHRRLLCVFGCGGDRDRTKRPRMARAVARWADAAFVTSDNPRSEDPQAIIEEVLPGFAGQAGCTVEADPDRAAAIRAAIGSAGPGDTVLIAGKGHEDYQVIGNQRIHFDDAEVARQCLEAMEVAR
ncbi:MAG: UDP-N-acetylmuramoyl-L-alanyl-D-glutamate--2,6-diaminopimelate ligase [Phycisphaerales bacterium]|nr:MAG: UDP-N-acetylmuramoyl-L-alanyl-D-glutamate--2,6-diaminopimelate ligase [Phycisphaerales bacterium]